MSDKKYSGKASAALEEFKLTRDFGLYLDMLNPLKKKYMIILCLKNTTGQNISENIVEKIRSIGFSNFAAEPNMQYIGILSTGGVNCDSLTKVGQQSVGFDGSISKTKILVSFENNKEAEIQINGQRWSLNDKGVNIAIYDLKNQQIIDVSCYNAAYKNPTFYHFNLNYDQQYIDSHIYVPETYKDAVTLPIRRSYFSDRSLKVREVERGIFLQNKSVLTYDKQFHEKETFETCGGICDENFNFIAGHQLFNPRNTEDDGRHILGSYRVEREELTYIDETVLYGGTLLEHPGHLITECFADRLWWIAENADSDIKIAVEIIWRHSNVRSGDISFVREYLEALGISEDRLIIIKQPTQFKKIIVPDQSSIPLNYCFPYEFTSKYIKPFQRIKDRLTPGKYKKIYLTKSKVHNKTTIGEEYFIDFFEKKGFKIIDPEDYSIKEKAELMYGADEVVTIDGTNSLFTVFCKPSVRLTVLTRRLDFWDTPQQMINEALGIKEFFLVNVSGNFLELFSDNSFLNYVYGLVLLYATKEFAKYVKYVYNEKLDVTPEESLKKYLFDYLVAFPRHYTQEAAFPVVRGIKMTDILRGMSEVFLGRELNTSNLDFMTGDEIRRQKLEARLQALEAASEAKIRTLTERTGEFAQENEQLKQYAAQLQAENRQLSKDKAELSAYMSEISSLLDALEAGGGLPAGE